MDDESIGLGTTEPQAAGTCATCGRPLTQCGPNGECLRCLVSLGFLADGEHAEKPAARGRLTPGPLKYAHFEVEVGADGFPVELGAGAMAITYRARDTVLNSEVALKVIDRGVAQNAGARSRFLREARAAANIHHPNVARVTYYGEQDGECFYAMELVKGETLEVRVRRDGPMPPALALEVIEQAARALAAAEACGVVHRDIKPSNIMLESDASDVLRVKLIDYGVAKVMGPQVEPGLEQTQPGSLALRLLPVQSSLPALANCRLIHAPISTHWELPFGICLPVGRPLSDARWKKSGRDKPISYPLNNSRACTFPGRLLHYSCRCCHLTRRTGRNQHANYFLLSTIATRDSILKRARDAGRSRWRPLRRHWPSQQLRLGPGCTNAHGLSLRWNDRSRYCPSKT